MNSRESLKGFITFVILISIVSVTVVTFNFVVNKGNFRLQTKASDSETTPTEIQAKNVTDSSADIIWVTQIENIGELAYSVEEIKDCNRNNCIIASETVATDTHFIRIDGLDKETTYFYKIKVGKQYYPKDKTLSFSTSGDSGVAKVNIEVSEPPVRKLNDQLDPEFDDSGVIPATESTLATNDAGVIAPDGFYNDNPLKQGPFNYLDDQKVLGTSIDVLNEQIIEEFKDAIVYQDKNYDFNGDKEVSNLDYPLFINFIISQE